MRWLRILAIGLTAVALTAVAGIAALVIRYPVSWSITLQFVGVAVIGLAIAITGLIIAWRVSGNPVGPLLTAVGTALCLLECRAAYEAIALAHDLPLDARVIAWFEESGWWMFTAGALLLLYFPDGQLPSRRWRWVPWALVLATALDQVYGAFETNDFLGPMSGQPRPYPPPSLPMEIVGGVSFAAILGLAIAAVVSVIMRYRRSTGRARAQLKWLAFVGLAVVAYPFVCLAEILLTGSSGPFAIVLGILVLLTLPLTVALAMLHRDPYGVDRALAAAVTYAIVSAVLLAIFVAATVSVGLVLGRGAVTAALATAICAVVLLPLLRRVQAGVDRQFNPPRRAARLAIESLQRRINLGEAQPEDLQSALRTALRDDSIRVGLRRPGTDRLVDSAGASVPDDDAVPVLLGGNEVGALVADSEPGLAALRAIAADTAILVHVIRLRSELGEALREVSESRARLVQAGIAERSRLERDLHDGAQQRLVALGMAIRTAQMQHGTDSVDINSLLDRAVAELATAVAELRKIAQGLRPSSLDDGLHAALTGMTRSLPVPVQVSVEAERLSDDLATTAYFVVCEAVTNAAKHADPERVLVNVSRVDGHVLIRVSDDGRGGASARPGSGLAGLVDRVAALGGSFAMDSPAGKGTVIEAVLPCE